MAEDYLCFYFVYVNCQKYKILANYIEKFENKLYNRYKGGDTMGNNYKLDGLKDKKYILKEDLVNYLKKTTNYEKKSSIRWVIHELVKSGKITKIDSEHFFNGVLKEFFPKNESERKKEVKDFVKEKYSNLDIIVYESTVLNEWINHQVSRNVIFVEVEKFFMEDVFTSLREHFNNDFLLNPSIDDYYLYAKDDMIIVSNLITRAPIHKDSREIRIEKLIVDIFSNDLISEFFSHSEYDTVINSVFNMYKVNIKKAFSYAKRRNLSEKLEKYVKNQYPSEVNK